MLTCNVQWACERRRLASNAADMHQSLGVGRTDLTDLAIFWRVQPSRYGELACPNRMRNVDVEDGIVANTAALLSMRIVLRIGPTGRIPEIRPVRLEDACTWAYLLTESARLKW